VRGERVCVDSKVDRRMENGEWGVPGPLRGDALNGEMFMSAHRFSGGNKGRVKSNKSAPEGRYDSNRCRNSVPGPLRGDALNGEMFMSAHRFSGGNEGSVKSNRSVPEGRYVRNRKD
jgi:hypothetical protein